MSYAKAVLIEAKRIWEMGGAVHWLHPKSKRPIGNGWTTGPRKDWKELKEEFLIDNNLGIRLGAVSKFQNGYLAVIDVDVKSDLKRHRMEAENALREIIGDISCPEVRSGRGNGSRHLYCLTEKPFKTWNPAASPELVKVMMPSKSPSKRELAELSEEEIKQGLRLSVAWEISLYSNGRQVVLPPSIHPDTGKPYTWKHPWVSSESLPLIEFQGELDDEREPGIVNGDDLPSSRGQEAIDDFKIDETLDIGWLPIDEATRSLIVEGRVNGRKIEDRSSYLLSATVGLISAGLNKNEILTVLTDRSTFLGECAYDHAKTNLRSRAAYWLWNYTVKKVMSERDAKVAFQGKAIVRDTLPPDEVGEQTAEFEESMDWKSSLERTQQGKVKSTFNNLIAILTNACSEKAFVGRDEFANQDYYLCDTEWISRKGDAIVDMDIVRIKAYCAQEWGVEFNDNTIMHAILAVADVNRYHPVRDYISKLEWDGIPRLETWLKDFAGAEGPDEYLKAVSRKVLVAMVKRVFEPGCKFDHVLILEGDQGVGKSTLLSRLAGKWFTDQPLVIGDKDAVLTMQSKWLIELGELSSLNRSEVEAMKAFVTQRVDRIRAPYGRKVEEHPRQSIFIGSTNLDEYLKDETGNRRFWPVRCGGSLDFDGLEKVRDQLFAEAFAFYQMQEPLYLENAQLNLLAKAEQAKRGESDEMTAAVQRVIEGEMFPRNGFDMKQIAIPLESFGVSQLTKSDQMRISKILKMLGCEKFQEAQGERRKLWRVKKTLKEAEPPRTTSNHLGGSTKKLMISDFY